jgi:hypothetical protein
MTVPSQFRIRGPILHPERSDTEIYITKNSAMSSVFPDAEQALRKYGSVTLHATGAAIYRALKFAVALDKAHPHLLTLTVSTRTIETTDYLLPLASGAQREARARCLNAVDILISRA